jgi:CDP-diglyceride synthetase
MSASVGIPLVLISIWVGFPGVVVLATVAGLIAGVEIHLMMSPGSHYSGSVRTVSIVMGPTVLAAMSSWMARNDRISGEQLPVTLVVIFTLALLLRGVATLRRASSRASDWVFWVFAAYVGLTLAHAPLLVGLDSGRELILMAIITAFLVDTAAMLVGAYAGRTRLAPTISPKKSWEGAIAGIIAGILGAIAIDAALGISFTTFTAATLGGLLAVTAILGDLYESWIKRRSGVKDSGKLIPGHGGILDRLDSVIPCLMVVYWTVVWSRP